MKAQIVSLLKKEPMPLGSRWGISRVLDLSNPYLTLEQ